MVSFLLMRPHHVYWKAIAPCGLIDIDATCFHRRPCHKSMLARTCRIAFLADTTAPRAHTPRLIATVQKNPSFETNDCFIETRCRFSSLEFLMQQDRVLVGVQYTSSPIGRGRIGGTTESLTIPAASKLALHPYPFSGGYRTGIDDLCFVDPHLQCFSAVCL